jgi:TFIIF-interacting CTD phosphatase-like protein
MGIGAVGGFQPSYITPLSNGPAAVQRTQEVDPTSDQTQAEEADRQASQQQTTSSAGNTTPTRGQNLNITV